MGRINIINPFNYENFDKINESTNNTWDADAALFKVPQSVPKIKITDSSPLDSRLSELVRQSTERTKMSRIKCQTSDTQVFSMSTFDDNQVKLNESSSLKTWDNTLDPIYYTASKTLHENEASLMETVNENACVNKDFGDINSFPFDGPLDNDDYRNSLFSSKSK